ncbi:MAG: DEAD/DEAH box helicase family protein [Phocaeicola sp.]
MAKKNTTKETIRLSHALVLNRFILSLFGSTSLEAMSEYLKDPILERYDENNVSMFYHELVARLFHNDTLTKEMLMEYDQNIYRHTQEISERRSEPIRWKYFQYISLLFTEVYLDRYFNGREALLSDLNSYLGKTFNADERTYHGLTPFTPDELNKIAFWNATGSGKTLLMHINIKQFLHYVPHTERINRIILLTPNEGLSNQHKRELDESSIDNEIFSKTGSGGVFGGKMVEIIEITKIAEKSGDKTIAVGSFEGNNLVLVDEGHRGSSGDVWKVMRNKLSMVGFSFEYSATFGQSVSAATGKKKTDLLHEYGKATLFDYSYRYFYNDGYGKDYRIMNLNQTWDDSLVTMYLTACLLSFYEQIGLYGQDEAKLKSFLLEKPLAIFVGSSVTAVRTENKQEVSDVVAILHFFGRFIANSSEAIANIGRLLSDSDELMDKNNRSIFGHSFRFLRTSESTPETIYANMLQAIFNSTLSGAILHLDNLKGQDGEIGLRVGNSEYFGVINVGDDKKLLDLCDSKGLSTSSKDFANRSLFAGINAKDSKINVLIGSKKFTEGWSSWRVSTMGLLNVGRGEGSEIIQLFGRGVRLKGYGYSLKRSAALDASIKPASIPKHLKLLETLNIFGIRADYMEQFKQYLEEEGLPTNDSNFEEFTLPILPSVNISGKKLKYLKIEEGRDFKKEVVVELELTQTTINVILDYYPRIQAMKSKGLKRESDGIETVLNRTVLSNNNLAFIDWDSVYFEMVRAKNEKSWYNLSVSKDRLKEIAYHSNWYTLLIPAAELAFDDFGKRTKLWQEIVVSLLKLYMERSYNIAKSKWMSENVVTAILDESHPNFEREYQLLVHRDLETIIEKVSELKLQLEAKEFSTNFTIGSNFEALYFSGHLYQPLLYLDKKSYVGESASMIELKPVSLNKGERNFIEDLKAFYTTSNDFFEDKELYVLRNQSRKGIGFFESSNFYPDFIVWLVVGKKQYVTFIDPKGLRNLRGLEDDKINLHKTIRETIEPRLNDKDIVLNSFIVSNTPFKEINFWEKEASIETFNERHVYFQTEQKMTYIEMMLHKLIDK